MHRIFDHCPVCSVWLHNVHNVPSHSHFFNFDSHFFSFIHGGNKLLRLRKGAPIRKFQLSIWNGIDVRSSFGINSLISASLSYNVQELDIHTGFYCGKRISTQEIFNRKTLVSLKLHSERGLDFLVPNSVFLPHLKVLDLKLMDVEDGSIKRIIQGCPFLEELYLSFAATDENEKVEHIDFSSNSLKKLMFEFWRRKRTIMVESDSLESLDYQLHKDDYFQHEVIINTPNLKYLACQASGTGVKLIQNLDSLIEAKISLGWDNRRKSQGVIEHLNRVQGVTSLCLQKHNLQFPAFVANFREFEHSGACILQGGLC
ncbi:hypothetical protein ACH5RR_002607 [Cinchona calisaya]|uniref:F-box/LRR-repeat protein 15/At3g58940/PEG3-like LRR domain-containing protein n=1 Tax=Cinchona calisaya TaxID=153742 RepID=A0ABD3ASJ5_9GENT